MGEKRDHNGWRLFRIASVSPAVPAAAESADKSEGFRFVGKICSRETGMPIDCLQAYAGDEAERTVLMPLTFSADLVAGGDGTIDLHLTLEEEYWDEAMRRPNYASKLGSNTLVFGHRVSPRDAETADIE